MKVFEIQDSFGLENLKETERPDPKPEAGQVLVSMKATSINYRDYLMVVGKYNPRQKLPLVPFSDGAGEVMAVGDGVSEFAVGDRVSPIFSQTWQAGDPDVQSLRSTIGGPQDGCLAEQTVFDASGLVKIPDHLSYEEAATLPCAALTAYNAVIKFGKAGKDTDVVTMGTGGVSIFALQFAKAVGANVIQTSSSADKLARTKELGADVLINYKEKPNWEKEVRRATKMVGADLIVEVGGSGTLQKSMMAVRPAGVIALIGVLDGGQGEISLFPILMQGITVQGVIVGSKADFVAMNEFITKHKINPVVDKVFPFSEARAAVEYVQSGSHFGKVVVKLTD